MNVPANLDAAHAWSWLRARSTARADRKAAENEGRSQRDWERCWAESTSANIDMHLRAMLRAVAGRDDIQPEDHNPLGRELENAAHLPGTRSHTRCFRFRPVPQWDMLKRTVTFIVKMPLANPDASWCPGEIVLYSAGSSCEVVCLLHTSCFARQFAEDVE